MRRIRIRIMPKKGLLDPQGRAVEEMLEENGFKVKGVRVGKVVEMSVPEGTDLKKLAEEYVVNTLIEDYEIEELAS
ncbi:MAG: phosphoribosylformylglycinamidine synthase subunit PurS [Aquificae bacterium]|nr:phosphoribosylformylglycinamidine synthase subunit PurS [Aquificota bacterium]